jgi:hypothetical protein
MASAIADLPLLTDRNGKNGSTVVTVDENPSAKGFSPTVAYLLIWTTTNFKHSKKQPIDNRYSIL